VLVVAEIVSREPAVPPDWSCTKPGLNEIPSPGDERPAVKLTEQQKPLRLVSVIVLVVEVPC
jgi:hypothetical protein